MLAVALEVDLLQVVAVDQNLSAVWSEKADHKIDERTLSRARCTDKCDRLALLNVERKIVDNRLVGILEFEAKVGEKPLFKSFKQANMFKYLTLTAS